MWRNSAATEQIIVERLVQDGTAPLNAREWSRHQDIDLIAAVAIALETLEPSDG